MLLEIICSNLLDLSVDPSKYSSAQLEKLQTLSWNKTSIVTEPIKHNLTREQTQLAKGEPNESRYRREADRYYERRNIEEIRDIDYERRRGIENDYKDSRYDRIDRQRIEALRNQIEAIDDRIDELEREKDRLEELEERYRRGYY